MNSMDVWSLSRTSASNRGHSVGIAWVGLAAVFFCSQAFGQKPEFDFFPDFRNVFTEKVRTQNPSITSEGIDRKSTRLNSSHSQISYAVFCLKKKKDHTPLTNTLHRFTIRL